MASFADQVHTSKKFRLGTEKKDISGNIFRYMKGGTSVAAGSWVSFAADTNVPTLIAADVASLVAVSMAANTSATNYSWYQVSGLNTIAKSDTVAGAGVALYIDGTAGRVDDAVVTGDLVLGAYPTAADTSNVLPVVLNRPFTTNTLS